MPRDMKDLLLFPIRTLKYYWGGLAIMLIGGLLLDMPDFLFGVGIGIIILYVGLLTYKLFSKS